MKEAGDPRDMKTAMAEFLNDEGLKELDELLRIREAWSAVVGEEEARISKPYRLEGGRLFVGVGSHAQVQNMLFRNEEIRTAVKRETGLEIRGVKVKKLNLM
ncbi:MAG: DUF721 domain-containing protein [Actinomycetota bacterium]